MTIPYEPLFNKLELVLTSKVEEFRFHNYEQLTKEQIWLFCVEKKWRKEQIEQMPIHRLVNTILSVKPSDMLVYEQIREYKAVQYEITINDEEMQALLAPLLKKPSP